MAFNLWKMLGLETKAAPDTSAYTNAVRPFQSLTEIPVGKTLNEQILAALQQGKGIGFAPEYAEKTTSPLVASRQARWGEVERPALESSLASRGLSRSTLGARDIGKAEASKERDINDIMGQAYKEQESQKKLDEARYQNLGMDFTGKEASQRGIYAAEDAARMKYASDAENQYRAQKDDERITDVNKTIGAGAKYGLPLAAIAAAPFTGGASLALLPAATSIGGGISDLMSKQSQIEQAEKATNTTQNRAFIGNSGMDISKLLAMLKSLGIGA